MTIQGEGGSESGVEVTRFIPIPKSVSFEAQQFLTMDLAALGGGATQDPNRDDIDAWRAGIKTTNEGLAAALEMKSANLRLTVETVMVGEVPVFVLTPDGAAADGDQPIYLDIHGGGFIVGSGDACVAMAKGMVGQSQMCTWSIDYRMPPDHPYPAALDDCVTVYRRLLDVRPAEQIVVGGASAGGNLAAALVLRARDEGLPMPAALVLQTPEVDLTESGDSFATNLGIDNVLTASLAESIALYAGDHDLTDPYLSPLFGDLRAPFPPTLLQAGTRDLFLSNTVRMHRKLRAAGIEAELHVFEAMPHGGFWGAPEDEDLAVEIRRFIASHLDA
jgi:monoterpene epsilon-lactone hydrolase